MARDLAEELRKIGMTAAEFSRRCEARGSRISTRTLSKIFNGERVKPTTLNLVWLAFDAIKGQFEAELRSTGSAPARVATG